MPRTKIDGRLDLLLAELRMPTIRRVYQKIAREVSESGGDYIAFLNAIVEEEIDDRRTRRVQRRTKEARFMQLKTLAELDAKALPRGVSIGQLQQLAAGEYLDEKSNIIAIGGSGTGKTHVSIGLGVAACEQGKRVRFTTAVGLVSELEEAQEQHQLHRYLKRLSAIDLLIVDELGYLPVSNRGAELLFQAFSERHERGSVILNSNLPFEEWAQIFKTERMAVALLDRVTHRATVLEMNGESYRLRSAKTRSRKPVSKK